jgi:hypothetical protein
MLERRRSKRIKTHRDRAWIAAPVRRWGEVLDASSGGIRLLVPNGIGLGWPITVYHSQGARLGPGRVGKVVHNRGRGIGIEYARDLASERREALRHNTRGIRALISGSVETPAAVHNLSSSGAAIEPILPLRRGAKLRISFLFGSREVVTRTALVVRVASSVVGVRFLETRQSFGTCR